MKFSLCKSAVLFIGMMIFLLFWTSRAGAGNLHLITISSNVSGENEKFNADSAVCETDCHNAGCASIVKLCVANMPPSRLFLYHFVSDENFPVTKSGRASFYLGSEPIADRADDCGPECRFVATYDNEIYHFYRKPEVFRSNDLPGKLKTLLSEIEENDAAIVYFCGHATIFDHDSDKEDLSYNRGENMTGLLKSRVRKNLGFPEFGPGNSNLGRPRFCLILSDCCSSYADTTKTMPPRFFPIFGFPPKKSCPRTKEISPLFRRLFFNEMSGILDIGAAPPGEPAISMLRNPSRGDDGWWNDHGSAGIFTQSFCHTLGAYSQKEDVEWEIVISKIGDHADSLFQAYKKENGSSGATQSGIPVDIREKRNHRPYCFSSWESSE